MAKFIVTLDAVTVRTYDLVVEEFDTEEDLESFLYWHEDDLMVRAVQDGVLRKTGTYLSDTVHTKA